jgi:hypothetical protein
MYGTAPLIQDLTRGNGVLSVFVLNELTVPSAVVADIEVNVFISMLDDFEVAQPDAEFNQLRYRPQFVPGTRVNVPEMDSGQPTDLDTEQIPVTDPPTIDNWADTSIEDSDLTKLFFGEVIGSYRQMLKRTYPAETGLLPEVSVQHQWKVARAAFPLYGGSYNQPAGVASPAVLYTDNNFYIPYDTTMMNYLGRCFMGWRGAIRITVDASSFNITASGETMNSITFGLGRTSKQTTNLNNDVDIGADLITSWPATIMQQDREMTPNGAFLGNTNVNPIQSAEIPYYKNARFSYTFMEDKLNGESFDEPGFIYTAFLPGATSVNQFGIIRTYVSAGEDFNFFFFNGMPPCYREQTYATDTGPPP